MLSEVSVDLIIITSPNEFHEEHVKIALSFNCHVVVEKPMVLNMDSAERIIAKSLKVNKSVFTFLNRRFDGDFLFLENLVKSKEVGKITNLKSCFNFNKPVVGTRWRDQAKHGAGTFYDFAPHLIDQVLVLFNLPLKVTANFYQKRVNSKATDEFLITFHYEDFEVEISSSLLGEPGGRRFLLEGEDGLIEILGYDKQEQSLRENIKLYSDEWSDIEEGYAKRLSPKHEELRFPQGDWGIFYRGLLEYLNGNAKMIISQTEMLNVVAVMDACIKSNKIKKTINLVK